MPQLPIGDPVPEDGALPEPALAEVGQRPFGMYVHVPWCSTRCGYCDFNTYVPDAISNASPGDFVDDSIAELTFARKVLGDRDVSVDTVFFGGGTPTLLEPTQLGTVIATISDTFGLAENAELTTEANPETLSPQILDQLRAAGFNRISIGMQSAVPHVLATLDRQHTPGRAVEAARWARDAGFEHVSLDLIYGTPGETADDWRVSLEDALVAAPDHVSAYALTIEEGTKMASRIERGKLPPPDPDSQADRYEMADALFESAGFTWYEVSNWAMPGGQCKHNLGYWRGDNWWGVGPGAHSHVGGTRWWNVKHPADYSQRVREGHSPGAGREVLDDKERALEDIMLRLRLAEGIQMTELEPNKVATLSELANEDLVNPSLLAHNWVVLTLRGRLLADEVVRRLT